MLSLKSVLARVKPVQDKPLSLASVLKCVNEKRRAATPSKASIVESSASSVPPAAASSTVSTLSDSFKSSTVSESSAVPPHASFLPSSASLVSVNSSSQVRKATKISKEDQGKIQNYLEAAVRPSSKKTYGSYWKRYKSFCLKKKFELNSAEAISLFLIKLAESSESKSVALSARTAIKFHLKVAKYNKKCSTDSYLVGRISKSIVKKYSKPVKKASTLSSKVIKDMTILLLKKGNFKEERTAIFFLVQFLLMARFEEVANVKKEDVKFLDSGDIEIKIVQAKNFGSWDSQKSYIAKGKLGSFDPVVLIKNYVAKLEGTPWMFPNFRIGRNQRISFLQSKVTYNNMLSLLRSSLSLLGLDGKLFTLHSPRTGALSEAANSEKVEKDDLQRHVRWKSAGMVNYYHQLSLEKKLSSSRALNIYD